MKALASEHPKQDLTSLVDDVCEDIRSGIREGDSIEAHGEQTNEPTKPHAATTEK